MIECVEGSVYRNRVIMLDVVWHNPQQTERQLKPIQAVVDTGATHSCISEALAQQLNLTPIGPEAVLVGIGGSQKSSAYIVGLTLPPLDFRIRELKVFSIPGQEAGKALLGMDVLSKGTFQFTNENRFFFCSKAYLQGT